MLMLKNIIKINDDDNYTYDKYYGQIMVINSNKIRYCINKSSSNNSGF